MVRKNNAGKAVVYVTVIVIAAKALGFIKQMITASYFGATIHTDLISISEGLINNVDYLLVQALTTAFVPTYIYAKNEGEKNEKRFVANSLLVFSFVSTGISIVIFFSAPIIARVLAPTYSAESILKLAGYIRIFSPTLVALVMTAIFNSLLKGNESFVPGEMMGIIQSVILIGLVILIGDKVGPDTLLYSFILYAVLTLLFLGIYSKVHWNIKFDTPLRDSNVIKLLKMMGPLMLGYSIVFVNQQVDKIIVSGLGEGVVTAMGYASVLSNFVCTFIGSISGVLFVYITQNIVAQKQETAAIFLVKSTIQMITIVLPVFVLTICNSMDIVTTVFGRGKFDEAAVRTCSFALIGYGMMFIPFVLREMFSRFQYGYGESRWPMINSSIGIVINIVSSIVLSRFWGVFGVTLATSISVFVCGLLNIKSSKRINDFLGFGNIKATIIPWAVGGLVCVIISYMGGMILGDMSSLPRLIIICSVALIVYGLINYRTVLPIIKQVVLKR